MDILDILDKLFTSGFFDQLAVAEEIAARHFAVGSWVLAVILSVFAIGLSILHMKRPKLMRDSTYFTALCVFIAAAVLMLAIGYGSWTNGDLWALSPEAKWLDVNGGKIGNLFDI